MVLSVLSASAIEVTESWLPEGLRGVQEILLARSKDAGTEADPEGTRCARVELGLFAQGQRPQRLQ